MGPLGIFPSIKRIVPCGKEDWRLTMDTIGHRELT
jgi:hypothetical protein